MTDDRKPHQCFYCEKVFDVEEATTGILQIGENRFAHDDCVTEAKGAGLVDLIKTIDKANPIQVGEIVQLDPEKTGNKMFAACLMIVTEVKSWGVQGYVQALGENGESGGQAYYRAATGTFERVGAMAPWIRWQKSED